MKLDIDCVRDVLLEFEKLPLGCHTPYSFPKAIGKHGIQNVEYTLAKLGEAEYINAEIQQRPDGDLDFLGIYSITYPGHQFLENIRENKVWTKTKSIAGKVGSGSFALISQIASSVITEAALTYLRGQI